MNMDKLSPWVRNLARRLLAASQTASGPHVHEAVVVISKLRITLTKFAGSEGFASLLRRALVLASAEAPSLQSVKIGAEGHLEGFEQLVADTGTAADDARRNDARHAGGEAAVAITAQLLGLLDTFIGKSLTLRLVREACPDTLLDDEPSRIEVNT